MCVSIVLIDMFVFPFVEQCEITLAIAEAKCCCLRIQLDNNRLPTLFVRFIYITLIDNNYILCVIFVCNYSIFMHTHTVAFYKCVDKTLLLLSLDHWYSIFCLKPKVDFNYGNNQVPSEPKWMQPVYSRRRKFAFNILISIESQPVRAVCPPICLPSSSVSMALRQTKAVTVLRIRAVENTPNGHQQT